MKIGIVGGVAGGASCATRLHRLDENAEIPMVERGAYVSYANCGLPCHVGGVIERESSLLVANGNTFRSQFAIDVRTGCEAIGIAPEAKTVQLRNVATGEVTTESYDKLVLSPGAPSVHPPGSSPVSRAVEQTRGDWNRICRDALTSAPGDALSLPDWLRHDRKGHPVTAGTAAGAPGHTWNRVSRISISSLDPELPPR